MNERTLSGLLFLAKRAGLRDDELDDFKDLVCKHKFDDEPDYDQQGQPVRICRHCRRVEYL